MNITNIKIGTIGRFCIKSGKNPLTECEITGVIVALPSDYDDYYIIDELGKLKSFHKHQLISISSIRISKELRTKFTLIAQKYTDLIKLEEEQKRIAKTISDIRIFIQKDQEELSRIAGFYSKEEFKQKIEEFDYQMVGTYQNGKSIKVMLQQSNKGERYSSPYEFPFLYQRYDGSCILKEENAPEKYKEYLHTNAPKINMELAKLSDNVSQEISVGDKYIYAHTKYWIHLKNGFKMQDVANIINVIK